MKRRSGFTLIEMMIVLAIIAALAATLVPIAMNALNQAKVTGNLTDVESIRMAQMQYYYKYGHTTDSATDLDIYLTWNNLQGENLTDDGGYDLTGSAASKASIEFTFTSDGLAKAFEAQFPATNTSMDFSRTGATASITYFFQKK